MAFDPYLYIAFGIGFVAGRLTKWRSPRLGDATLLTVVLLVGLLGAVLGALPGLNLAAIPLAIAYAALILWVTILFAWGLPHAPLGPPKPISTPPPRIPASVWLLVALLVGFGVGRTTSIPAGQWLPYVLYFLLALVAFDLKLSRSAFRNVWVPLTASIGAALVAAGIFTLLSGVGWVPSLATSFGFGFYSLAGPLVTARFGATLGLLAFLTNFLRENLTMLLAPWIGRRVRAEGLTAMGGATAMDTTLFFIVRYGDSEAGGLALTSGLVLTVAATLLLPILLGFPGA
ncbi:MAG: lysine exporter LysO family protein [Thermoplasmata archaeon]